MKILETILKLIITIAMMSLTVFGGYQWGSERQKQIDQANTELNYYTAKEYNAIVIDRDKWKAVANDIHHCVSICEEQFEKMNCGL